MMRIDNFEETAGAVATHGMRPYDLLIDIRTWNSIIEFVMITANVAPFTME